MVKYDPKTKTYFFDTKEPITRKHLYKSGFRTKKEAQEAERLAKGQNDISVQSERLLYDVVVAKLNNTKNCKSISSYSTYSDIFKLHINGILENKPIGRYTREEIDNFYNKLSDLGRSNNTINKVNSFLVNVFNYAFKNKYILYNPIVKMDKRNWKRKKVAYWTYKEFEKAMEFENDPVYRMYWIFCMHNGIRKCERVIKWTDVDLVNGYVDISEHLYDGGKGSRDLILQGRKNNDGLIITLDKYVINELTKYKEYVKQFDGYSENWYVFGNYKPLARTTIARKLDELCERAGVTRITPHSFRHSCVSICYQAGLEDQIIASRIGDSVEQIHRTYGHLKPNADKPVANLFDELRNQSQRKEVEEHD